METLTIILSSIFILVTIYALYVVWSEWKGVRKVSTVDLETLHYFNEEHRAAHEAVKDFLGVFKYSEGLGGVGVGWDTETCKYTIAVHLKETTEPWPETWMGHKVNYYIIGDNESQSPYNLAPWRVDQ